MWNSRFTMSKLAGVGALWIVVPLVVFLFFDMPPEYRPSAAVTGGPLAVVAVLRWWMLVRRDRGVRPTAASQ